MPAASSVSRIGGRRIRLGTGRVTSLMTTQALRRPRASSRKRRRPDRLLQALPHRRVRIGQRLGRPVLKTPDDVPIGQFHIQTRPAVFQVNSHG